MLCFFVLTWVVFPEFRRRENEHLLIMDEAGRMRRHDETMTLIKNYLEQHGMSSTVQAWVLLDFVMIFLQQQCVLLLTISSSLCFFPLCCVSLDIERGKLPNLATFTSLLLGGNFEDAVTYFGQFQKEGSLASCHIYYSIWRQMFSELLSK